MLQRILTVFCCLLLACPPALAVGELPGTKEAEAPFIEEWLPSETAEGTAVPEETDTPAPTAVPEETAPAASSVPAETVQPEETADPEEQAQMQAYMEAEAAEEATAEPAAETLEENTQVKHYLLLGEDGYAENVTDDARTDTIVILSMDEKYNRIIMTSILRDSCMNTPKGNPTKINTIYKAYGFDGLIECIERELDIEIEGGILVNFNNVKPVIDALGGVDIEIDINEYISIRKILLDKDPNMPAGPGLVHMTGRIALAYMRDRKSGSGDFGRTEHQRKVVKQLLEKCRDLPLTNLIGIYNQVSAGMKMSLGPLEILSAMSTGYSLISNGAKFEENHIPGKGTYSYGSAASASSLDVNWKKNRERLHTLLNTPPAETEN